jgi:putative spermidine/putrescine transport system ATP-binding protein
LLVRPERLHVAAAGAVIPAGYDHIPATVEDCIYLGSSRTVQARTSAGKLLIVRTDVPRAADGVHIGAQVQMHWGVDDARVLA